MSSENFVENAALDKHNLTSEREMPAATKGREPGVRINFMIMVNAAEPCLGQRIDSKRVGVTARKYSRRPDE